jgi:hypothetical protein
MKNALPVLLVSCMALLSGCSMSVTAKLFPVKGPYSEQKPIPVLRALVKNVQGNSGDVTLTLPNGEVCTGTWSSIAPQQVSSTSITGGAQLRSGIQSAYATVYGTGFTVSNVPGINRGTAYLVGDRGTTIEVEFFTGSGTASGNGVATDSNGNIYKVLF